MSSKAGDEGTPGRPSGPRVAPIIDAVAYAAIALLRSHDVEAELPDVMRQLGQASDVSRVYVYQNVLIDGELGDEERFEWDAAGIAPTSGPEESGSLYLPHYERYVRVLGAGGVIAELSDDAPQSERAWLQRDDVLSSVLVPIFVRDSWWGYIGFDDCWRARTWAPEEVSALRVAAETMGAAIERQELDASLAETQRRYRTVIEQAPSVIVYADHPAQGSTTSYVSPQIEEILGVTPEEWISAEGNDLWEAMVHPEDRERALAQYEAYLEGGPDLDDYRMVREDGRIVWIRDRAKIEPGADGEPVEWGVMIDVTDQHEMQDKLREAEARYRALIEQIPAVAYTESGQNRVLYISPRSLDILGVSPERWLEEPDLWAQLLVPEDRERALARATRHIDTAEKYVDEYRLVKPDGSIVWVRDEAVPILDAGGHFDVWQGLMIDITEQKRAEEAAREAEERFRLLVEQIAAVTYMESADERASSAIYISPQIERLVGYTQDEWLADQGLWESALHPDDRDRCVALAEESVRALKPFISEHRMVAKDGTVVWVHDENHPVLDDEGNPMYWLGVIVDITEQREALFRLREAEVRFQLLVEEIPVITYIEPIEGTQGPRYISPQYETILGHKVEDWISDPDHWRKAVHPDDLERAAAVYADTDRSHEPYSVDLRGITADGRQVWLHEEAHLVTDEEGQPLYWLGAIQDVTARKETEDLERALALEKEATAKLRELDELKDQFLAGVSHDLRTPLSSILGFALTLQQGSADLTEDDRRHFIDRIAVNARKLQSLVDDLLDVHRLSQGAGVLRRSRVDLGALVAEVVGEADYLSGHAVTTETQSVVISADETKIRRLVENLLTNTARHTPHGTRVWVRVSDEGDSALLTVEDSGPGIPDAEKPGLFDEFTTGAGSRESGSPGLGVGLSLVSRFAELHGGRAWLEDRSGGGSVFRVSLPKPAD